MWPQSVSTLEQKQILTELIFRVNRLYETHEYEAMVQCYTEDAHYRNWRGDIRGRSEILSMMEHRPRERLVRHVISNVVTTLCSADSAEGMAYVTAYINHHGDPLREPVPQIGPPAIAEYNFRFRKVEGEWLISEKVTVEVFSGMQFDYRDAGGNEHSIVINPPSASKANAELK